MLTRLFGFVFKIFLGRQIPPSTLGAYTIALSVAMVFVTALTSGIPLVISRNVASNIVENKQIESNKTVTSGLIISIILALVFSIFIVFAKPLFMLIFTDESSYETLIPFIIFSGVYAPFKGYLWGKENYFGVSLVEFIEQILKIIICIILFVFVSINPTLPAGLSISIACVLSTFVGVYYYKKEKGALSSPYGSIKPLIRSSLPLTTVRFIGSLLMPIISVILPLRLIAGGFSNEQALSLIGIAMGMTMPILTIPSTIVGSLSMALIPQLSILQKSDNSNALFRQIESSVLFTLICTFFIVPMFIGIGEPICEFLFGNTHAGTLLSKFAWIVVPVGLTQLSTSMLNSIGKEFYTFATYTIGGIVFFLSIIFLTPLVGIEAFFISMGLNGIIVSLLNIIQINKCTKHNLKIMKKLLVLGIIVLFLSLLCYYVYNLLIVIFPMFISIAISCSITAVGYLMLLVVFNVISVEYLNSIKSRLKVNKKQ